MAPILKKLFNKLTLRCFGALAVGVCIVIGLTATLAAVGNFFDIEKDATPTAISVPQSDAALQEMTKQIVGDVSTPANQAALPEIAPASGSTIQEPKDEKR